MMADPASNHRIRAALAGHSPRIVKLHRLRRRTAKQYAVSRRGTVRSRSGRCGRCEAQPMRSTSETMIPSGPRT